MQADGKTFTFGKCLGKGGFSEVWLAEDGAKAAVAIKCVPRNTSHPDALKDLHHEVRTLSQLDHPNVVKLRIPALVQTPTHCFAVLEHAPRGDLCDALSLLGAPLEPEAVKAHFRQLLSGVAYLHREGVAHQDLKPDNILLMEDGRLCLADFGLSGKLSAGIRLRRCGTVEYMAPEALELHNGLAGYRGTERDMWSLGIILHKLWYGVLPFDACSSDRTDPAHQIVRQIREYYRTGHLAFPNRKGVVSDARRRQTPDVNDLIRRLLSPVPKERPAAWETLNCPWLSGRQTPPQQPPAPAQATPPPAPAAQPQQQQQEERKQSPQLRPARGVAQVAGTNCSSKSYCVIL